MTSGPQSDETLMAQVAQGDRECLTVLMRRYATPLLTFIRRMVGNRHRSEELFQDVFMAVWTGSRQYRYPLKFKSWVFGIAANKCRADARKLSFFKGRTNEDSSGLLVSPDGSPGDAAVAAETSTLVLNAVATLPPNQRAVLALRVWNDLSFREIADAIGCSEATARSHMYHALTAMRKHLEPRMR